ncbi:MAG: S-methyl-5'-thioinosine phosphorylase [Betaproteobacteria bacterium]|nr:S-methyl-5'-thioinosine phosphorylase [Betaproteobacteria bacterium]
MLAIIGGSGLSQLASLEVTERRVARTPFGEPSGALTFGRIRGSAVVFLARHGYGHTIAPHKVNYRANIHALGQQGVSEIVSVASVGGIRRDFGPGALVVPNQIIDYTWGRHGTFFDGPDSAVTHIDFTEPYTQTLRGRILAAARTCGEAVADGGVYATTQGPRLETAAEINRLERDGADLVGMTGMPEASLAREAGLAYAAINVVANYAAGRGDSEHAIALDAIEAVLEKAMGRVRRIIEALAASPVAK